MRSHRTVGTALLAAALLLAAFQSTAHARFIWFSEEEIRATFPEFHIVTALPAAVCPVTLEGTLHHENFAKVNGALIGYITRAFLNRPTCMIEGGANHVYFLNGVERDLNDETVRQFLPWHIRYETYGGALPRIEEIVIRIIEFSVHFLWLGQICLYASTTARPARFELFLNAEGKVTSIAPVSTSPIPRGTGGMMCPAEATLFGPGQLRKLGTTSTSIIIRLI